MNVDELLPITFTPGIGELRVGYKSPSSVELVEVWRGGRKTLLALRTSPEAVAALEALRAHFETERAERLAAMRKACHVKNV